MKKLWLNYTYSAALCVASITLTAATDEEWVDHAVGNASVDTNWKSGTAPDLTDGTTTAENILFNDTTAAGSGAPEMIIDQTGVTIHRITTLNTDGGTTPTISGNDFTMADDGSTQARIFADSTRQLSLEAGIAYNGTGGLLFQIDSGVFNLRNTYTGTGDLILDGNNNNMRARNDADGTVDFAHSGKTILADGYLDFLEDIDADPFSGSSTIYLGGGNGTTLGGVDGSDDVRIRLQRGQIDFGDGNTMVVTSADGGATAGLRELYLGRDPINSSANAVEVDADITLNETLDVILNASAGFARLNGNITGTGGLNLQLESATDAIDFIQLGGGGAVNTYSGDTTIGDGIEVRIAGSANDTAIGDTSAVTIEGDGQLAIRSGADERIGSLASASATSDLLLTVSGANTAQLFVGGDNTSTTYAGTITSNTSQNNAINKEGTGIWTLTNSDTGNYIAGLDIRDTGGVTLDAAYLGVRLNVDDNGTGTGALGLDNGATLFMDLVGSSNRDIDNPIMVGGSSGSTIIADADDLTNDLAIRGNITLNQDLTIDQQADASSGSVINLTGSSTTLTGAGNLVLKAASTAATERLQFTKDASGFTGDFVIESGYLRDTSAANMGTADVVLGATAGTADATWEMQGGDGGSVAQNNIYENNLLVSSGSGLRVLTDDNAARDLAGGADPSSVGRYTFSGNVTLNGNLEVRGQKTTFDNNTISGSGLSGLIIDSAATVQIGANTDASYTGDTIIEDGTLQALGGDPFSGSTTIYIGGDGGTDAAALRTGVSSTALDNAIVVNSGTGLRTLDSANMTSSSANTTISSDIVLEKDLRVRLRTSGGGAGGRSLRLTGDISGAGGLELDRTASGDYILLTGNNTYAGTTTIENTEVRIAETGTSGIASGIPDGSIVLMTDDASELRLSGTDASLTIGSLASTDAGANVVLSGSNVLTTGGNNADTIFSGTIDQTGSMTKEGTGTFTLTGANTYTGTTTVNDGTLALSAGGSLSDSAVDVAASGATFDISAITAGSETIGSLAGVSGATVSLGAKSLTAGGDDTDTTFSGVIQGTGGVSKDGTGVFTLSGANTFSGGLTVNDGTLLLSGTASTNANAFINKGTLALEGNDPLSGTGTINIGSLSDGTTNATLQVGVSATDALNNDINIAAGTGTRTIVTEELTDITTNTVMSSDINLLGTNNVEIKIASTSGARELSLTGAISGTGGVVYGRNGSGAIRLSQAHTYSGDTTIQDGVVLRVDADSIPDLSAVGFRDFTTGIEIGDGVDLEVGSLASIHGNNHRISLAANASLTVGGNDDTTTFGGYILQTGAGASPRTIEKTGTGTMTLTRDNLDAEKPGFFPGDIYDGEFQVSDGTLLFDGDFSESNGAVTVNTGATLGGTGTVGGAITVDAGGFLAPGASAGTLTTGDVTVNGTLALEVDGASADQLSATGTVDLSSATITLAELSAPSGDLTLITATLITGDDTVTLPATPPTGYEFKFLPEGGPVTSLVLQEVSSGPSEVEQSSAEFIENYSFDSGAGTASFDFISFSGSTYEILFSDDLTVPVSSWSSVYGPAAGTGGQLTPSDVPSTDDGFYILQIVTP